MVELVHTLADHIDDVNSCTFSDSLLATCSLDKTIRVYSLNDFSEAPFSPLRGHTYGVHCCCFAPHSPILATCSTDGKTILWSMDNGQVRASFQQPTSSPVRVCKFSPNSLYLASGAADGSVVLWNVPLLKIHRSSSVKDGSLVACTFSPDSKLLVTGSSCGDLTVWDENLRCLHSEKAHDLGVACCDFAAQPIAGAERGMEHFQLASCGQDNEIRLWLISYSGAKGLEMRCKDTLSVHSAPVLACAFSNNGEILVSGSVDKSVIIYKVKSQCIVHILTHHTRYVTACSLAPTYPLLAIGSMDKTVSIWKLRQENDTPVIRRQSKTETHIENWSEDDIKNWLSEEGLSEVEHVFTANNIDGKELLNLSKESLLHDLKIESLGVRNKILRKIEEIKSKMKSTLTNIPDEFLCPITCEIMKDPVIASDGYSYERSAIENWISTKRTSPMTNLPLENLLLTPNRTLKMALNRWLESRSTTLL
ncbi:WD repeat, SAM and U-box domain-containing 1 isoform X1 [Pelobates cultripes]|uniref:WD repeat, SAM and U-box domain-containing protein 1 n=1 Tax=Pelobates cultripes TaxID=61616 RepID=A0AAD1SR84_PELCU|nr:WD repeat, SAM and U-box domain-containing 1 isoform X1 [Pelobates cultripes]